MASARLLSPAIVCIALLLVGFGAACGGDEDDDDREARANDYALEQSGGERLGCSTAAPGPESEAHPGCIYSVAFSGCYEGITGEQLGPLPIEEEFPREPKLQEIYRRAISDCSDG